MKVMRIWFVCSFGMALSLIFDWDFGFLAIITPAFVLNLEKQYGLAFPVMLVFSIIYSSIEATFIYDFFQAHPLLLTGMVAITMLVKCIAMMHQVTYLFGFMGIFIGSMTYNFASYDFFDITDFNVNMWIISVVTIGSYLLSHLFFPDPKDHQAPADPPDTRTERDKIAQVAMGWAITMLLFIVFQTMDLFDSLAALVSIVIILSPLNLQGSIGMGKVRVIGTGLGCLGGLIVQFVLGKWFGNPLLFWLAFTIVMGGISSLFAKGMIPSAIAFSAISALSVPLTTALVPEQQDATYNILYRFSSIFVAVLAATTAMYLIDRQINRLVKPAT